MSALFDLSSPCNRSMVDFATNQALVLCLRIQYARLISVNVGCLIRMRWSIFGINSSSLKFVLRQLIRISTKLKSTFANWANFIKIKSRSFFKTSKVVWVLTKSNLTTHEGELFGYAIASHLFGEEEEK